MRSTASFIRAARNAAVAALLTGAVLAPAAAHAATPRMDGMERAVVRAINHHRAAAGLRHMRPVRRLARAADFHTREMLAGNYFAHSSIDGGSFSSRIHRFTRARRVGETLAWMSHCGRRAARRFVSMWMHSPPHRAILMSRSLHHVGIGRRSGSLGGGRVCVVTGDFSR
jgi:uncharacterized protein YkwD